MPRQLGQLVLFAAQIRSPSSRHAKKPMRLPCGAQPCLAESALLLSLPLLQAIKQAGRQFSRPPIGPVGQYLNLEDSR